MEHNHQKNSANSLSWEVSRPWRVFNNRSDASEGYLFRFGVSAAKGIFFPGTVIELEGNRKGKSCWGYPPWTKVISLHDFCMWRDFAGEKQPALIYRPRVARFRKRTKKSRKGEHSFSSIFSSKFFEENSRRFKKPSNCFYKRLALPFYLCETF